MPDDSTSDLPWPGTVLLLSAEDDPSDTIKPRPMAAGGSQARVRILEGVRKVVKGAKGEERESVEYPCLTDSKAFSQKIIERDVPPANTS